MNKRRKGTIEKSWPKGKLLCPCALLALRIIIKMIRKEGFLNQLCGQDESHITAIRTATIVLHSKVVVLVLWLEDTRDT